MSASKRLLIAFAIMTGFLLYMAIDHEFRRSNGDEMVLDMEPVDPRSLFRGHYVRIRTDAHQLNPNGLSGDDEFVKGQNIYVALEVDDEGSWHPNAIFHDQPKPPYAFIKGIVSSVARYQRKVGEINTSVYRLSVQYNIESYFADKASAKNLETLVRDHKMRLILSVGPDGRAVIKGIEIDGERQLDTLY